MQINIILPVIPTSPSGGPKIMYEYANYFAKQGHQVFLYHVCSPRYLKGILPHYLRYLKNEIFHKNFRPRWYDLDKSIKSKNIPRLRNEYIKDANVTFFTNWTIAEEVFELSEKKGKKVNLIQDYELWIGNDKEKLHASYRLPITHVVIADYLADIVEKESGIRPTIIYNGINENIFKLKTTIEDRNSHTVSMLFSLEERKGSQYGLNALRICKKEIPDLQVELFGIYPKPKELENWINYTQKPKNLCSLFNSTAIYFTPSNGEGWALPPAEAMFCGCALVCTNIGGHAAYAKKDKTALLTNVADPCDMANKLLSLLQDNDKRITLAKEGNKYIKQFNWDKAVSKMLLTFEA